MLVGGETTWQHVRPSSPALNMWKRQRERTLPLMGTAGTSEVGGGWAGSDGGGETRHWDPATGSRGLSGARLRHLLDVVNYLRSFFPSSFPYSFTLSFSHTYFGSTTCVPNTANKKGPILPSRSLQPTCGDGETSKQAGMWSWHFSTWLSSWVLPQKVGSY